MLWDNERERRLTNKLYSNYVLLNTFVKFIQVENKLKCQELCKVSIETVKELI